MSYDTIVALLDDETPARPSPGKFEGNEDARVAQALYALSLDGAIDEQSDWGDAAGWMARIGRFLIYEDSQGFFRYEDHETEEAASADFDRQTREEEDDA